MPLIQSFAFTLGILGVLAQAKLPDVTWLAALVLPALLPWRWRPIYACTVLGVLLTVWRGQTLLDQRWPESRYGEEVWVQGHIASLPDISLTAARGDAPPDKIWRFLFEPTTGDMPPRIRASWYRNEQVLEGGQCWRMLLRLRPPHGSVNPGGFDYEGWLFRQGIGATATVKAASPCGDRDGYVLLKMRQALINDFRGWLPEGSARALFIALTLGDTSELGNDDWNLFRETGTTQISTLRSPAV